MNRTPDDEEPLMTESECLQLAEATEVELVPEVRAAIDDWVNKHIHNNQPSDK